jgi:hypothetical protein
MNDELKITDDQLRLATSRSLAADVELEGDSRAAREAFLSLGTTVESAAGSFDEAAFLARLKKSCLDSPVIKPKTAEQVRDWFTLLLTGTLAAAAFVAIVRIAAQSSESGPHLAINDTPAPVVVVPSIDMPSMRFAWNDPLDDEIALAAATLEQFGGRRQGFDNSLLNMNDQLQSLSQELLGESL